MSFSRKFNDFEQSISSIFHSPSCYVYLSISMQSLDNDQTTIMEVGNFPSILGVMLSLFGKPKIIFSISATNTIGQIWRKCIKVKAVNFGIRPS